MTYQIYSQQQLYSKSLAQLKRIYSEIGCTLEVQDRRCKDEWRSAIARYQSAQLQKIARPAKDEQAIAQGEFDQYIADQAEAIAPTSLKTVELSFYEHEVYAGSQLVATITYDHHNFVTQAWVVMVNGVEKFRHQIWNTCYSFITWHFKQRTLNKSLPIPPAPAQTEAFQVSAQVTILEISDFDQQQYQQNTLPPQEQSELEESCTTDNEIIVQIFNECEQCGLELLEDRIYTSNGEKLGEVGFTDELWCFARVNQKRTFCDSALIPCGYCKYRILYLQLANICNTTRLSSCHLENCNGCLRRQS
ncbi:hypothetical protein [Dendronalium sp. ChiSLP03b]|uniref:hypothetical protein n=1 Tax=Dendronalium sp. ChiSLP03b TaxID=3075381 RepID=UPI002AD3ADAA|nr:hypothetical protein [Dendronalium sp. ChiSLP03b]MDZ8206766.1 hypothetical protein [Dendronalium sp. ChiSLP03b]